MWYSVDDMILSVIGNCKELYFLIVLNLKFRCVCERACMWRVRVCRPEETASLAVLSYLVSAVALRSLCCLPVNLLSVVFASSHCRVLGFRCVPPNPAFFSVFFLFKRLFIYLSIYLVQPPPPGHPGIHFVGLGSGWPSDSGTQIRLFLASYMFYNTWQVKCSPVRLDIHLSNNIR